MVQNQGESGGKRMIMMAILGPSPRFLSGISYFTMRLSNALAPGNRVTAVLFRNMLPTRLFPGWRRVGSEITELEFDSGVRVEEILDWYNPLTWAKAYRTLRRQQVIVLEWWTSSVAHMYLALCLMNRRKVPVVIEFHEVVDPLEQSILPIRYYARLMGTLIRRRAVRYVVHSDADRSLITTHYRIPEEEVTIIPHGLYDQYKVFGKSEAREHLGFAEKNIILFFGLLRPYKGVPTLIHAFEELPGSLRSESRLVIAGEAWEDQESVRLARSSAYAGQITVIDRYVEDREISLLFSASDLLVIPYTRASQSGVAHIAMAYGLPVVASEVGGLVESLGGYQGTTFTRPGDTRGVVEGITKVLKEKKNYPVPEELRWDRVAERWEELCGDLVKEDGPGTSQGGDRS
ncbi:glycosyltransferase [Methanolinea mesophila]|uniref:glycosyltransferase n=1 Tax=Methanolinea mesophila TaxID=547055 RepID=UPI001FD82CC9|nr:glycosyltransferase [Methanolinea mesophila]